MSQIPYAHSNGSLSVQVILDNAADVFLVDSSNFNNYKNGRQFKYYGGHYNRNPVVINVSGSGTWYLIVRGSRYKYKFY